jgi:hypothetical protein
MAKLKLCEGMDARASLRYDSAVVLHEQNPREINAQVHLTHPAIVKVLVLADSVFGFVSSEESVAPISLPATDKKVLIRRITLVRSLSCEMN